GFDSHAFPPARPLLALVTAVLLSGGPALAQSTAPPSQAPTTPAAAAPAPPAASPAPAPQPGTAVPRKLSRWDAPRWVMMRPLVLRGWGQLHNGSWIKAGLIAGVEGVLIYNIVDDLNDLDRLQGEIDAAVEEGNTDAANAAINAYNDRQSKLVARQWFLGGA